jgi:hypothetical protein
MSSISTSEESGRKLGLGLWTGRSIREPKREQTLSSMPVQITNDGSLITKGFSWQTSKINRF